MLDILGFISRHPHLETLSVGYDMALNMDSLLLPCLSDGRWSNLTSLSLGWQQPWIDKRQRPGQNTLTLATTSIAAIGKFESLEQLHLSVGDSYGWRHQWLIDHDALRANLRGLRRLKRLAFSRDTYLDLGDGLFLYVEDYYGDPIVPPGEEDGDAEIRWTTPFVNWERLHRRRMIWEADKYVALFPGLEWIFCGEWSMGVRKEQTSSGVLRSAVS